MDPKVVGKFIKELRKEKNITQEKLAIDLLVDRTTVVKWEGGKALPTNESLVLISDYFNVTLDEILNGKRYSNYQSLPNIEIAKTESKNKVILSLLNSNRKNKRLIKYFILLTSLITIIFLIYYFFTTYNSIHVYTLYGEGEKYAVRDSLLIITNEKVYLRIGVITEKVEYNPINVNQIYLYTNTNNNKKIFEGDPNELLVEKRKNIEIFKNINLKKEYNNFYLVINHQGNQEKIYLTVKKDYHNKGILFNKINTNENLNIIDSSISLRPNKDFKYNTKNDSYYLKKDNFEITYFVSENYIRVYVLNKNSKIRYNYYITEEVLNYSHDTLDKSIIKNINLNNELSKDDKEIINSFKSNYLDKYFSETNKN